MEQIQSAQYSGLLWEDESRTMFRIPWKHAGKQDYNQEVDASIFKVRLILPHLEIVLFFVFFAQSCALKPELLWFLKLSSTSPLTISLILLCDLDY